MTTELKAQTIVSNTTMEETVTAAYLIGIHWKGNPLNTI